MNLSQIRNRIEALERRFALPLTAVRLRPHATLFCDQWAIARGCKQTLPETPGFIHTLADAGFRLPTYTNLSLFLERHRENNTCPMPSQIVSTLLPGQKARKIINALFRFDRPRRRPPAPAPALFHPIPLSTPAPTRRYHSPQRYTPPNPPIRKEDPHGRANNGRRRHSHRGPQQPRR